MSNETYVTIRGYVGADPVVFHNDSGRVTSVIRVGVTARIYDRRTEQFADGVTAWYSVRCYGDLADNVVHSVHKGTPVLVRGRLAPRQWADKEGNMKTDNVIVGDALGIELSTGLASFTKARRTPLDTVEGEPAASSANLYPTENLTAGKTPVSAAKNTAFAESEEQSLADIESVVRVIH